MQSIDQRDFEVCRARAIRAHAGINDVVNRCLTALHIVIQFFDTPHQISPRLCRDAGLNELDIERDRIAKSPLIR
ncbi:hypothetical protein ACFQ3C_16610 [Seohaeicola saemankumensis]|uniref:Uncharacterized protein n=1 Tax=Seohaeicola saemankumensis TaxID=481181 RepID=A0ABW3TGJ4_9RHOB